VANPIHFFAIANFTPKRGAEGLFSRWCKHGDGVEWS